MKSFLKDPMGTIWLGGEFLCWLLVIVTMVCWEIALLIVVFSGPIPKTLLGKFLLTGAQSGITAFLLFLDWLVSYPFMAWSDSMFEKFRKPRETEAVATSA